MMDDGAIDKAVHFYCDPMSGLLRAMVRAEGGEEAFVRAVKCSFPSVISYPEALARAGKTLRNRVLDFENRDVGPLCLASVVSKQDPWTGEANPRALRFTPKFLAFLAARWAPIGVANDPTNLNAHWLENVETIYRGTAIV